jgi:hypothetical protein
VTLQASWNRLAASLDLCVQHFRDFAQRKVTLVSATQFSFLDECLLEGLISRVWQRWSEFCRDCVVKSCLGTTTGAGAVVTALVEAINEDHVSGAAIRANRKVSLPYWGNPNALLRLEPTWGDVNVLVRVIGRLRPSNAPQLLAAFSSCYRNARALQVIRNCAAHNHIQNFIEVQTLRSAYIVFPINHPTQAMFWTEPSSGDFLITYSIQELKDAGLTAIR